MIVFWFSVIFLLVVLLKLPKAIINATERSAIEREKKAKEHLRVVKLLEKDLARQEREKEKSRIAKEKALEKERREKEKAKAAQEKRERDVAQAVSVVDHYIPVLNTTREQIKKAKEDLANAQAVHADSETLEKLQSKISRLDEKAYNIERKLEKANFIINAPD